MDPISIKGFYKTLFGETYHDLEHFFEDKNTLDVGHFNVFNIADLYAESRGNITMPYNRRTYYKISLIQGQNVVEYADKSISIAQSAVLFATPKIPFRYIPLEGPQTGHFCVFTKDFLAKSKTGINIDELPVFTPGRDFVYHIDEERYADFNAIYEKMHREISSDYPFKYDLIRNLLIELLYEGQKMTPVESMQAGINAASRITALFIDLLERQYPIENYTQTLRLRTASDFADRMGVHVNHLNKALRETTGKTTTEIIAGRLAEEAKILLRNTNWNISQIAYSLGFDEVAYFSTFFKKQVNKSPGSFRSDKVSANSEIKPNS